MQQITDTQRAALRVRLATMPPEMRYELVGLMRVEKAPAELISVAESAIVELREMERKHKAEMSVGSANTTTKSVAENEFVIPVIPKAFALLAGTGAVVFVSVYYVLIPAAIALAHGVVMVAPYVAGAAVVFLAIAAVASSVSGARPSEAAMPSGTSSAQTIYTQNIYINQHVETNNQTQGK